MDPKIQNFENVQKPVTYVIQLLVFYQCTKFQVDSSIFDPPNCKKEGFLFTTRTLPGAIIWISIRDKDSVSSLMT